VRGCYLAVMASKLFRAGFLGVGLQLVDLMMTACLAHNPTTTATYISQSPSQPNQSNLLRPAVS
jgi:hypothetical protein